MRLGERLKIGVLSLIVIVIPLSARSEHVAHPSSRHPSHESRLRGSTIATVPSSSGGNPTRSRFVRTILSSPADFDRNSLANLLPGDWEGDESMVPTGNKETYGQQRPSLESNSKLTTIGLGPSWYFAGLGYFTRGGRADSNFIRFGRHSVGTGGGYTPSSANTHPNKKNNFIRLGRENLRQNNFIRLGRGGGYWDNRERVGFLPDYISTSTLSSPRIWSTGEVNSDTPLPFDTSELSRQG